MISGSKVASCVATCSGTKPFAEVDRPIAPKATKLLRVSIPFPTWMTDDSSTKDKRILVIGGPGSGKTFVSKELRKQGHNAIDADSVEGLSAWVDENGDKADFPKRPDREWLRTHQFIWDRDSLKSLLERNPSVYLFGVSHNVFEMMDLFDKTYYLDLDPKLVRKRMLAKDRLNPLGKTNQQQQEVIEVVRGLKERAKSLGLRFIDSSLSPKKILERMA